jgi:hypothetical protein
MDAPDGTAATMAQAASLRNRRLEISPGELMRAAMSGQPQRIDERRAIVALFAVFALLVQALTRQGCET